MAPQTSGNELEEIEFPARPQEKPSTPLTKSAPYTAYLKIDQRGSISDYERQLATPLPVTPESSQSKGRAFKNMAFGSGLKITLFFTWVVLMVATPFGVRIEFTQSFQPPIVFIALIIRNIFFYMAILAALRPESYSRPWYIIIAILLGTFTTPWLTSLLALVSMGSYILTQVLIVRQLEPAVTFLVKPPTSSQIPSSSGKNTLIVVLEMVGYLAVVVMMNFIPTDLYFLEMSSFRLTYWIMPAVLLLVVAMVFYAIIASKKDPIHTHLAKQFTIIIPLLLAMGLYMAYRFWTFSLTYEGSDPTAIQLTYGISETINAFLWFGLTLWELYETAPKKSKNQRSYSGILWLYTLTLYNIWFEPMYEAQGTFIGVVLFTGAGVYFLVRSLSKNLANVFGLPPKTKFRHLLFKKLGT